jgi:hypothetical protein
MRKDDGIVSGPIGKNPFKGTRGESWIRREQKRKGVCGEFLSWAIRVTFV